MVSLGAILGANTRFIVYKKLERFNISKEYIILVINTFSSFCLGFFLSFLNKLSYLNFSYQLVLFFLIGFLGSLSTFSTFVYDLFIQFKLSKAFKLFIESLFLGVVFLAFGAFLGKS